MGGVIQLDVLGKGYGDKYAIAFAPLTGAQKITGTITIEVDIEQLATDLVGSADWGKGSIILLFVDDAYVKYWLNISLFGTALSPDFYAYDPDTDTVSSRISVEDPTHQMDTSIMTVISGAQPKTTKTISINPCGADVFNKSPLYLIYVMFFANVGGAPGSKGWKGNFYRAKVTQP